MRTPLVRVTFVALGLRPSDVSFAAPDFKEIDVFMSGQDGYHAYRIPAVIKVVNARCSRAGRTGKVAAAIPGISTSSSSAPPMADSRGAGARVWDDADNNRGNPCPFLDETAGTLWLLLTHNLGADRERDIASRTAKGIRTV